MPSVSIFSAPVAQIVQSPSSINLTSKVFVAQANDTINTPGHYVTGDELLEELVTSLNSQAIRYLNKRTGSTYQASEINFSDFMGAQSAVKSAFLGEIELVTQQLAGNNVASTLDNLAKLNNVIVPATAQYAEIYVKAAAAPHYDYILVSCNNTPSLTPQVGLPSNYMECKTRAEIDTLKILGVPSVTGSVVSLVIKFWNQIPS